jgi:hypothetical protein
MPNARRASSRARGLEIFFRYGRTQIQPSEKFHKVKS